MPPKDLDEPQDMDAESSTAPALDEAETPAADAQPETEAAADPSPATGENEADTLSVVRDVVEARAEQPAEAASPAEGEEGETGDEAAGGPDNENYSDVEFHKHPRFQHLVREKNSYREDAGRYRNVENFLAQNNLTANEAADVMTIAGLAKTDPQTAWKQIQPWVQNLLIAAGEVLPDDLQRMVNDKAMTPEAALEVSRSRAAVAAAQARQKFEQERGQRQQQVQQGQILRDTSEQWLANRRLKDPNFAAKEARLYERIVFLQKTEGVPNTPDGVKAQLKKGYDYVNRELGSTPRPKPVAAAPAAPPARRPITPVRGGAVAGNAAQHPAPKTSMDVVKQVVAARKK